MEMIIELLMELQHQNLNNNDPIEDSLNERLMDEAQEFDRRLQRVCSLQRRFGASRLWRRPRPPPRAAQ